ncbi:MAG: VWA domain-containing protein [Candidatus Eremiobacterota bacterium]
MINSDNIKTEPLDMMSGKDLTAKPEKKLKEESFATVLFKFILLLGVIFLICDGAYEVWLLESPLYWKISVNVLSGLFLVSMLFFCGKTRVETKISVLFLFFISVIAFSTSYFGTFHSNYTILKKGNDFLSVLLLITGTVSGIIFIMLFPGMPKFIKIILSVTGFYVLGGNLHVIITGTGLEESFYGIWLWNKFPLFLRPAVLTLFYFLPLVILLIIIRIITKLIKKESSKVFFAVFLLSILIITSMGLTSFYFKTSLGGIARSFEGMKGIMNVLSRENGGEVVSFSTQFNLYDQAAFRLNDGEIDCFSPLKWASAGKAPFPHQIVFSLAKPDKDDAFMINRIIIYNSAAGTNTGIKDFEIYFSMTGEKKSFLLIKKFTAANTPLPQEFKFNPLKAKFIKISILSNYGNEIKTELTELEILSDNIPLKISKPGKNIGLDTNSGRIVSYTGMDAEENISVQNLIKKDENGTWQIKTVPGEVVIRTGRGKTSLIDTVILSFPANEKSSVKDIELLVSPVSPLEKFNTICKASHEQNKREEIFSFPPVPASYLKLRILSVYGEGKPEISRCKIFETISSDKDKKNIENKILQGLNSTYYSGLNFKKPVKKIIDEKLDFFWKDSPPFAEMDKENYSVNWKGYISPPSQGLYEIAAGAAPGSGYKIYIDNEPVMEELYSPSMDYWNKSYFNFSDSPHSVEIFYYKTKNEKYMSGGFKLAWKKPEEKDFKIITKEYSGHIPDTGNRTVRDAVQIGLDRLARSSIEWQNKNKTFSSYVQPYSIMSLSEACNYNTGRSSVRFMCDYIEGATLGDGSLLFDRSLTSEQFAGMSLAYYDKFIGNPDKKTLISIAGWLVKKQDTRGSWTIDKVNPPVEQGDIMVTANSLITIKQAVLYEHSQEFLDSLTKGLVWLESSEAVTTQDLAFRILGLALGGPDITNPVIKKDITLLVTEQNADGGWGDKKSQKSNPFSTGQVLYALNKGGFDMNSLSFMKGVSYLMDNQEIYGSWSFMDTDIPEHVTSALALAGLTGSFQPLSIHINNSIKEISGEIFNYTGSDIYYVECFLDEKPAGKTTKSFFTIPLPDKIPPGIHKVKATVVTRNGQKATGEGEINIQGPLKLSIVKPEENDIIGLNSIIKVNIKDDEHSKIKKVEYFLNDKLIGESKKTPFDFPLNTRDIPSGFYELKATVYNYKELVASDKKSIKIEKPFTIKLLNPSEGQVISEEKIKLHVDVNNQTGFGTEQVEYYLDDKSIVSADNPPYDREYKFSEITNGKHTLMAVAINENNDKATDKKTFLLTKGLKINIKYPKDGHVITGIIDIKSEVLNKTESPAEHVEYFIDDLSLGKLYKTPYTLEFSAEKFTEGKHRLKAVVYCKDGSQSFKEINIETAKAPDISIVATVTDRDSKKVELQAENFILKEDGVTQWPLDVQNSVPLSLVLILDNSKSMNSSLDMVKDKTGNFINLLEDTTRTSVIFFSDSVQVKCDFTSDKNKLRKIISTMSSHGGSALFDSIYEAIDLLGNEKGRKVIVLLTDAVDENDGKTGPGSRHNVQETLLYAKEKNVILYPVGLRKEADKYIVSMAGETGGITYFSPTVNELQEIYFQLADILRCQYVITYKSSDMKKSWRKITVNIKDRSDYIVHNQSEYKPAGL